MKVPHQALALALALSLLGASCLPAQPAPEFAAAAPVRDAALGWPPPILDRFPSLRWIHPGSDALQHLLAAPSECLHPPAGAAELLLMETGRQLFRLPALLGAQAAEQGLSCHSCHPAGQAQPRFHLPGLDGIPGSVDLPRLGAIMGGDAQAAGPSRPIPDLHDAWRRARPADPLYAQSPASYLRAKLALFAAVPSEAVLAALSAYLDALSGSACPRRDAAPFDLGEQLFEITRSIDVLQGNAGSADSLLNGLLAQVARQNLRALRARFELPGLAPLAVLIADRETALAQALEAPRVVGALRDWLADWLELAAVLRAREQDSLYDRELLERWLLQASREAGSGREGLPPTAK